MHCNKCNMGSYYLRKFGFRKTKQRGRIQRYLCTNCGNTFIIDDGFKGRHYAPETISRCLSMLMYTSLREARRLVDPCVSTLLSWLKVYGSKLKRYLERNVLRTAQTLHLDELFLKMNDTFRYLWDSIDNNTRFAFWFLSETRRSDDAVKLLNLSPIPYKIVTDGAFSYQMPIKEKYGYAFYYQKYHRCENFEDKKHNNLVERLQNTLRRYLHPRRGFHSVESGNIVLGFYWVYYNFIRPHMGLKGLTPAEAAGLIRWENNTKEVERIRILINN